MTSDDSEFNVLNRKCGIDLIAKRGPGLRGGAFGSADGVVRRAPAPAQHGDVEGAPGGEKEPGDRRLSAATGIGPMFQLGDFGQVSTRDESDALDPHHVTVSTNA